MGLFSFVLCNLFLVICCFEFSFSAFSFLCPLCHRFHFLCLPLVFVFVNFLYSQEIYSGFFYKLSISKFLFLSCFLASVKFRKKLKLFSFFITFQYNTFLSYFSFLSFLPWLVVTVGQEGYAFSQTAGQRTPI